jgi:hypothetical protein
MNQEVPPLPAVAPNGCCRRSRIALYQWSMPAAGAAGQPPELASESARSRLSAGMSGSAVARPPLNWSLPEP